MSVKVKAVPTEFAAAYIQTLPHAKERDSFDSEEAFNDYLDARMASYFNEFINASFYAQEEFQKIVDRLEEDDR